ncbi:hypothetical protein AB205_0072840 [Aquarana catesbeiana]|uniref:Uncharacterized protein n=1 Tax=Aquarana catesbeiana TaxID=8400 RepID=A0A2G9PVZ2_AQUCT|nr:hypothetical protein AB205_0072840 [Aquarana catesbeiana]
MGQSYFYTNYWPVYSLVTLLFHITNEYNLFPMQSIDKYKRITFFFSSHFSVLKGPFPPHAVQCFFLHQTHMESRLYGFQWLCSQQCSAFSFPQKVKCGKVHQKRTGPQYSGEIKQKNNKNTHAETHPQQIWRTFCDSVIRYGTVYPQSHPGSGLWGEKSISVF